MKKITLLLATLLSAGLGTAVAQETVDVTYTYTLNGETIGHRTVTETVGNAPTDAVPAEYVEATGYPETIASGTTSYTIATSYKTDVMPFTPSTEGYERWYILHFPLNGFTYYWYAGETAAKEKLNLSAYTISTQTDYKFKFEGDWLNGYTIKSQSGKYITAVAASASGNQAQLSNTITELSRFLLNRHNSKWRFKLNSETKTLYLAHTSHSSLNLSFWGAENYTGGDAMIQETGNFAEEVASARALLNKTNVGYPAADAASRTALKNALGTDDATVNKSQLTPEVVNNYKVETNIKLPEDGHVYIFTNKHATGGLHYLYHDQSSDNIKHAVRGTTPVNELPDAAKFVCSVVNGKYLFANIETGNYLVWRGSNAGTNSNKGYLADYDANFCPFQMEKCVKTTGNYMNAAESTADFVGCVNFGAKRSNVVCFAYDNNNANNGYFNQDQNWTPRYDNRYSTVYYVEEVTDYTANQATLHQAGEGEDYYSTLWLPYSTNIPEGIAAYTAALEETGRLTLTPLEGAIPAKTGVVLRSGTPQENILFAPASQATTGVDKGQLSGNGSDITTTGNEYVLSGAGNRAIGFYPVKSGIMIPAGRAYYQPAQSNAHGFLLQLGTDDPTGIASVTTGSTDKGTAAYDLQGRRVARPSHGIYIVNGKKMIVK